MIAFDRWNVSHIYIDIWEMHASCYMDNNKFRVYGQLVTQYEQTCRKTNIVLLKMIAGS